MSDTIKNNYKDIADAIRAKKGTSNLMTPQEMVGEIANILKPTGTLDITENGEAIDVAAYATVNVDVQGGGHFSDLTDLDTFEMGKTYTYTGGSNGYGFEEWTAPTINENHWYHASGEDIDSLSDEGEFNTCLYFYDEDGGRFTELTDNYESIFLDDMEIGESKTFTYDSYGTNKRFTITRIEEPEEE